MASCKCGGKTVKIKTASPKKATPKKVTPKKVSGDAKGQSSRLSQQATKKATAAARKKNPYAKGCNCS